MLGIFTNLITSLSKEDKEGIQFSNITFNMKAYESSPQQKLKDSCRGFLNMLSSFCVASDKETIKVYYIVDQLQEYNTDLCGNYCLMFLYNLFNPLSNSDIVGADVCDFKTISTVIRESFHEGSKTGRGINTVTVGNFLEEFK